MSPTSAAVADFYRGKTVKIIVGFAPGGTYDNFSRLAAKYLPKYLPGSPTVVVENRPGAGTILAANGVYNTEPKDGTVIGVVAEGIGIQQLMGTPGIQFDAAKFQWVGSTGRTSAMCMIRKETGINSIQQLLASGREIPTSSPGRGTQAHDFPALMNGVLGTKFKLITGYASGPETQAAFEKGEVDGFCTSVTVYLLRQRPMVEGPTGFASLLAHSGSGSPDTRDPAVASVPSVMDLADDAGKQAFQAFNGPLQMTFPMAVAPEVPADRVNAIRRALESAYRDPEYIADARQFEPGYSPENTNNGEAVTRIVQAVQQMPAPVLERLKAALQ